jgi:predicted RNA polymerase sigma factor
MNPFASLSNTRNVFVRELGEIGVFVLNTYDASTKPWTCISLANEVRMDDNPVSWTADATALGETAGTAAALASVVRSLDSNELILSFNKATSSLSASVSLALASAKEAVEQFINKNNVNTTKLLFLEIRIIPSSL